MSWRSTERKHRELNQARLKVTELPDMPKMFCIWHHFWELFSLLLSPSLRPIAHSYQKTDCISAEQLLLLLNGRAILWAAVWQPQFGLLLCRRIDSCDFITFFFGKKAVFSTISTVSNCNVQVLPLKGIKLMSRTSRQIWSYETPTRRGCRYKTFCDFNMSVKWSRDPVHLVRWSVCKNSVSRTL